MAQPVETTYYLPCFAVDKNPGRRSNGSAVRVFTHRQTDGQEDGSDSMTSTADAGGNDKKVAIINSYYKVSKYSLSAESQVGLWRETASGIESSWQVGISHTDSFHQIQPRDMCHPTVKTMLVHNYNYLNLITRRSSYSGLNSVIQFMQFPGGNQAWNFVRYTVKQVIFLIKFGCRKH